MLVSRSGLTNKCVFDAEYLTPERRNGAGPRPNGTRDRDQDLDHRLPARYRQPSYRLQLQATIKNHGKANKV